MGNVSHHEKNMDLWSGDTKKEEYLTIYPVGKLPFITDGDVKLGESNAILKYLCETKSSIPENLWPKDLLKRAFVD